MNDAQQLLRRGAWRPGAEFSGRAVVIAADRGPAAATTPPQSASQPTRGAATVGREAYRGSREALCNVGR